MANYSEAHFALHLNTARIATQAINMLAEAVATPGLSSETRQRALECALKVAQAIGEQIEAAQQIFERETPRPENSK